MTRGRKAVRIFIWLSVFGLVLISPIARGSDSILIEKTDKAYVFIDNESIKHISKNIVRARVKYFPHTVMEPFRSKYLSYYLSYYEFDCDEKRAMVLQTTFYFKGYTSEQDDREHPWSSVAPDTVESALFEYVCKYNRSNLSSNHQEIDEKSLQPLKPPESTFTVQAGTFRDISRAEDLKNRLVQKAYKAYIAVSESKNNGKLYKVCIGEFSSREEAESLSVEIEKTEGLETFVTSK
jgi:hypothetical protein